MNLFSPKGNTTRPITDRVKESIFSVLTNAYGMPEDCKVADIFSGTGSFGLEALSRGAAEVTFVELNREVVEILERNIEKARYQDYSRVVRADAFKAGAPVIAGESPYDLAFVDPPYPLTQNTGLNSKLGMMLLEMNKQMRPGGLVLVRTHYRNVLEESYGHLKVIERRKWGNMNETFLRLFTEQYELESDIEDFLPGIDEE
jgi:16S rRNA (guanine(966)-N(2))-methyltransferase RsmD